VNRQSLGWQLAATVLLVLALTLAIVKKHFVDAIILGVLLIPVASVLIFTTIVWSRKSRM
jgi:hypothetical protein